MQDVPRQTEGTLYSVALERVSPRMLRLIVLYMLEIELLPMVLTSCHMAERCRDVGPLVLHQAVRRREWGWY